MKKLLAATCLALVSSTAAMAQDAPKAATTTETFVGFCQNKGDVAAQNFCHGFGQGVYDTYLITRHSKNAPHFICAAASNQNKTRQDYITDFVKWTAANPRFNQMAAADTILRFLGESYPCKKG